MVTPRSEIRPMFVVCHVRPVTDRSESLFEFLSGEALGKARGWKVPSSRSGELPHERPDPIRHQWKSRSPDTGVAAGAGAGDEDSVDVAYFFHRCKFDGNESREAALPESFEAI
jgi:hypothetical protein